MCGRYYIAEDDAAEDLRQIIEEVNRRNNGEGKQVKTSGEIFPTDLAPVVANNRNMQPTVFAMEWGYTLPDGRRIINARSETAHEKGMFKDGLQHRRCLIPASSYFEWEKKDKDKIKYDIRPSGGDTLYMAGIYRIEGDQPVFTILTREPAESIAFIHDRMPVILPNDMKNDWLNLMYEAAEVMRAAVTKVVHRSV